MLDKKDAQWWVLEAQKRPESAVDLIRILADRLAFLDKQNEELRGDMIALQRRQRTDSGGSTEVELLKQRIQDLESALRQAGVEQRLIVYAADRIEKNVAFKDAVSDGLHRPMPEDVRLLACAMTAKLLIVTADSRLFNLALSDLPMPSGDDPAPVGNPREIVTILEQGALDQSRFLLLVSRSGHVYSILAGTTVQVARRQEKLIRNLLPDDPIVDAMPSYNADIFGISNKGRWTRFPEKSVAGTGSRVMDLPKGDTLAGVLPLRGDSNLVFLTADGKLFMRPSSDFPSRKVPGASAGMPFKGQTIVGVASGTQLVILTHTGRVLSISIEGLPLKAQSESGTPVPGLRPDETIRAFFATN